MLQNLSASVMSVLCVSVALNLVGFGSVPAQATRTLPNPNNLSSSANQIADESPKPGNGRRETKEIAQAGTQQGSSPMRGSGRRDSQEHNPLPA